MVVIQYKSIVDDILNIKIMDEQKIAQVMDRMLDFASPMRCYCCLNGFAENCILDIHNWYRITFHIIGKCGMKSRHMDSIEKTYIYKGGKKMKKELSLTDLKKILSKMGQKDTEKLLCNLYKNCDMAEKIMNMAILGDAYGEKLLEEYKEKMYAIFFPKDLMRAGFSLSWAKSLITEFKKICSKEEYVIDFQLYYVECGTEFTNTFGDIDMKFYDSLCSVYHTVVNAIIIQKENTMFQKFADRFYGVVYDSDGIGWGYHDYVEEEYYQLPWIENNE